MFLFAWLMVVMGFPLEGEGLLCLANGMLGKDLIHNPATHLIYTLNNIQLIPDRTFFSYSSDSFSAHA